MELSPRPSRAQEGADALVLAAWAANTELPGARWLAATGEPRRGRGAGKRWVLLASVATKKPHLDRTPPRSTSAASKSFFRNRHRVTRILDRIYEEHRREATIVNGSRAPSNPQRSPMLPCVPVPSDKDTVLPSLDVPPTCATRRGRERLLSLELLVAIVTWLAVFTLVQPPPAHPPPPAATRQPSQSHHSRDEDMIAQAPQGASPPPAGRSGHEPHSTRDRAPLPVRAHRKP